MRYRHAFMFVLPVICFMLSCKKDKDPDWIKIGRIPLTQWSGEDTTIVIPQFSSSFTATSDDPEIAKVSLTGNGILVSFSLPGSTMLRIKDGMGNSVALNVHSRIISGSWTRRDDDPLYKPQVTVETADPVFANELKAQVQADVTKPQGGAPWGIIFKSEMGKTFQEMRGGTLFREGTYSFRDLILKLTVNGKEEVHKMNPYSSVYIGLEQDLTAEYKLLYPGKVITKVVVNRIYRMVTFPG